MAISLPDDQHRLRCGRCGNLTRFDIVRTTKLKEFWHVDMSGQVSVESPEVLDESISSISCRWCGATDEVEHVLRPSAGGSDTEPDTIK
jgi:hypothetical protein